MLPRGLLGISGCLLLATVASAQVFGTVRVIVRDPQNLAVAGAEVTLTGKGSASSQTARTNSQGEAQFLAPFGPYTVSVSADGFSQAGREIAIISNTETPVQVRLEVAGLTQSVSVGAAAQTINPESSSTQTLTHREDILLQPMAD